MIGAYYLGQSYLGQGPSSLPRLREGRTVILARIFLDSGTENVSDISVRHPERYYEARILQWGSIQRAVPVLAGLPQVGDARIRLADTDFKFRDLFVDTSPEQTPLERLVQIRVCNIEEPEVFGVTIYTGEIVGFEYGDEYCDLSLRDITWSWLDEEWPGTLDSGIYMPTIFGRCIQNSAVEQHGLIPLPHIGLTIDGDRYGLSIHTVQSVIIHRHNLDGTWEIVDPAEYSITEDDVVIGGLVLTGTYIDFTNQQDDGVEIRADVEGWNERPIFGSLAASSGVMLRSFIDLIINIMDVVQLKIGRTLNLDTDGIIALRNELELGVDTSPPRPYLCDGAILEPITIRSLLSQVLSSATLDLFQKVDGSISLARPGNTITPYSLTENLNILEGSFRQISPERPINRIKCKMARNYADGSWSIEQLHDNTADQAKLGRFAPKITAADLEMWFCRDRYTATDAAARRAGFLTLTSWDEEFELTLDDAAILELCGNVGLTIRQGLAPGGFQDELCRINAITIDLDNYSAAISARIWREQELNEPSFVTYELNASLVVTGQLDAEVTG